MRATPLTIWAHQLEDAAIAAAAAADARLSHPNQACQDASAAYCIAVAALIRRPGDAAGALAAAEGWAAAHARAEEVPLWLSQARDDAAMENYHGDPLIGWAKHAFLLAFYHLRRRSAFEEGLRHALLAGGDTGQRRSNTRFGWHDGHANACPANEPSTHAASYRPCSLPPDTNAAICCGMLGALHGVSGIPPALRSQVEGYRHGTGGSSRAPKRPDRLLGCHIAPLATQLYEAAVTDAGQRQGEKGGTTAADSEPACGGSDGPT